MEKKMYRWGDVLGVWAELAPFAFQLSPVQVTSAGSQSLPCEQSCRRSKNKEREPQQHPCMSSSCSLEHLMAAVGCNLCWLREDGGVEEPVWALLCLPPPCCRHTSPAVELELQDDALAMANTGLQWDCLEGGICYTLRKQKHLDNSLRSRCELLNFKLKRLNSCPTRESWMLNNRIETNHWNAGANQALLQKCRQLFPTVSLICISYWLLN